MRPSRLPRRLTCRVASTSIPRESRTEPASPRRRSRCRSPSTPEPASRRRNRIHPRRRVRPRRATPVVAAWFSYGSEVPRLESITPVCRSTSTQPSPSTWRRITPRRVAHRHREVGDRAGDHRSGADHHVAADVRTRQHDRTVPQPGARADRDRTRWRELTTDRFVDIFVAMVGIGDVHVMAGEDVVADLDRVVRDDPGALPEEHAVADAHARRRIDHVAGRDTCRKRDPRAEDATATDVDVLLAEQCSERERDHRELAEAAEAASARTARTDRREVGELVPTRAGCFARE